MTGSKAVATTIVVTVIAGGLGYACATAYLTFRDYGFTAQVDWAWLARSYFPLRTVRSDDFWLATNIIGGFSLVGLLAGGFLAFKRGNQYE